MVSGSSIQSQPVEPVQAKLVNIDTGEEIFSLREAVTIGRSRENDLVLQNLPLASRHHARIYYYQGTYFIEDLGSTNGTFVNGFRIDRPVGLRPNDRLFIGGFVCEYRPAQNQVIEHRRASRQNNSFNTIR